jgi:hypothetical protein
MPLTLEDLDRRVTALELAQSARGANAIARLEQKVDAFPRVMAEMIAESEQRMGAKIVESEDRLRGTISTSLEESEDRLREAFGTSIDASERRMREVIHTVVSGAEQRTASLMNDFEQRILVALDRLKGS